jgi:hypothetical protein
MARLGLIIWLLNILQYSFAYDCCGTSGCVDSCPWDDACDHGKNYNCMDEISGPFKCNDMTACRDYDTCDDEEAAYRAGNLCHSFPWYNGGYPVDHIK